MSRTKKLVPTFWWDFSYDGQAIIVQGSYPGGEELMRFPLNSSKPMATAEEQIAKAEKLIEDFKSGRKTPNWQKVKP